jgi:hypothetical protein
MSTITFKQWLKDTYDREELQGIAEQGCESGVAGGMIYYSETCALYDKHAEELHEVLGNYLDDMGEELPSYISKHIGHLTGFKNAMVWFVAEYYANDLLCEESEA